MSAPLDRPVWHALESRQRAFAAASGRACRYLADVAPFAAAADDSPDALADLAALIPEDGRILLLQAGPAPVPPGTAAEMEAEGVQMVAGRLAGNEAGTDIVELGAADAAEMVELASLTKPGPFLMRTHELGSFVGIRAAGQLVAMAGERMKLPGLTEVSGVCTHPEFRGRGYARRLSLAAAARIAARGETPFLHAFAGNRAAIRLYEQLGFVHRSPMRVLMLRRA
ncbi:GNAT family N-acetyltransferase [Aestuariivirga sp.]|uniref:GNAT family N-acetyltransferase n=1 Tax=Aestuariivirga sp. TaxID=2650926 RepID=UPI003918732E